MVYDADFSDAAVLGSTLAGGVGAHKARARMRAAGISEEEINDLVTRTSGAGRGALSSTIAGMIGAGLGKSMGVKSDLGEDIAFAVPGALAGINAYKSQTNRAARAIKRHKARQKTADFQKAEAKDDSFFDKIRAGFRASQQYSPKQIKQLGTKGAVVRPKGSRTKTAMFYEKLAETKEEKKRKSNMAGNLLGLGIGGAGVVGASRYHSRPQRDFEKNLKDLAAKTEAKSDALFDRLRTIPVQARTTEDFKQLFQDTQKNRDAFNEATESLRETLHNRSKHRGVKALALGGLGIAGGIGAKKLYDRYNQRKQRED